MNEPAFTLLKQLLDDNTLPVGSRLLVAVSGGADSMALLHLYLRARETLGLEIAVATFDHRLRGDAGRDDMRYVEATAAAWGVPCFTGQAAVSPSRDSEAWAREARYAFLSETARAFGAEAVATAHHADDQAETVLAHIVRGTGARGLGGMRPVSAVPGAPDLKLIRPLLNATRADLVAYCQSEAIAWRDDATNIETRYRRNWYRQMVMPLLREANPDVTGALARLASLSAEQDDYMRSTVLQCFHDHAAITEHRIWLPRDVFMRWHVALQRYGLIHALELIDAENETGYERIQAAAALAHTAEGGIIEMGGGIQIEIDGGWLTIARSGAAWSPPYAGYWMLRPDGRLSVKPPVIAHASASNALIKISVPHDAEINVRCRRQGDRVYPRALLGRSQKLKDWLINRKVPRLLRDSLPVIEADGQVVAIWDGRVWEAFTPPFSAAKIEISLTPNNETL